jgi:ArsR family transcriptional regulator
LSLLREEELSVNELQEVTRLGQSRISTHLRQMQEAGLLRSRRDGKRTFYACEESGVGREVLQWAMGGAEELAEHEADQVNLKRILARREDQAQLLFNQVAGRFDRSYGPGRSWQAFGQMLLRVLPPLVVADLGAGEGLLSELLARRARKVIAVDNSESIVAFGAAKAAKNGLKNLEFRLGDIERPPIAARTVDLAVLSQALHHAKDPAKAVRAVHRILKPGGQVFIQYGDKTKVMARARSGFAENDPARMRAAVEKAGYVIEHEDTTSLWHSATMLMRRADSAAGG